MDFETYLNDVDEELSKRAIVRAALKVMEIWIAIDTQRVLDEAEEWIRHV